MNNRKIYAVGGDFGYSNWMQGELVDNIKDADLVLFTGGEDVHPKLYNEKLGSHTYCNLNRDLDEAKIYNYCLENNIKMIGICRGNQFLTVMSGGRLVQHQENPSYFHPIITYDNKELLVNSTHHQASYPYDLPENKYKLLGWTEDISRFHLNGDDKEISDKSFKEVEVIYFPETKCLGIQPHPEMLYNDKRYENTIVYFQELLNKFMNNEL